MDSPQEIYGRVGVLGGTFDPVHNGHLAVAETVRQGLALDLLLFVPAFLPPHKLDHPLTPFAHRAAMLEAALKGRSGVQVSRLEAQRHSPSYSIDTLRALHAQLASRGELFFLVGMDAFAEIASWKHYLHLLDYAHLVVVARPDQCGRSCGQVVADFFPGYHAESGLACWRGAHGRGCIHTVAMEPVMVSSSAIRQAIRLGRPIDPMVSPEVAAYIASHGLYR